MISSFLYLGYLSPLRIHPLPVVLLHYLCANDLDFLGGAIFGAGLDQAHALHDAHAALDAAEDGVLAVEPGRGGEGDEELRAVGVGAGVGHAQDAGARVPQLGRDLVGELVAVDGGAAAARARRVPALDHEGRDDAVEDDAVVVPPGREGAEVLAGPRRVRGVELDGDDSLREMLAVVTHFKVVCLFIYRPQVLHFHLMLCSS